MFLLRIGQKIIFPLMIIVCILLIVLLQLGFIFLLIALLPSIAAYFEIKIMTLLPSALFSPAIWQQRFPPSPQYLFRV